MLWKLLLGLVVFYKFRRFFFNLPSFVYWKFYDFRHHKDEKGCFKEFGLRLFAGRQGTGKTVGIIYLLEVWRKMYPNLKIYTNFEYVHQEKKLESWDDILTLRNGTDGVVFVIDELQNEFSSNDWKDFPQGLLAEVTQQRKQRVCILGTSQIFKRVVVQLREQCFQVIEPKTYFKRWTRLYSYDAYDYNCIVDSTDPSKKFKLHKLWKESFIQSNYLRSLYDTNEKVQRLKRFTKVQ